MIPLKDLNPRLTLPFMTVVIILVNTAIFLWEFYVDISLGPQAEHQLINTLGMIPARIPLALTSHQVTFGQAFLPLLTSMFLHGGWFHLIGNMWFLWIFGDNIEDHLGHFNYVVFYLVCGVGASIVHTIANLGSTMPAVGASGAISGVMGAYVVLFPRSQVLTLVPIFFFFTVRLPAVIFLGYWFLIQFFSGIGSLGVQTQGGVAVWAHVGGFVLGALLVLGSKRR